MVREIIFVWTQHTSVPVLTLSHFITLRWQQRHIASHHIAPSEAECSIHYNQLERLSILPEYFLMHIVREKPCVDLRFVFLRLSTLSKREQLSRVRVKQLELELRNDLVNSV